MSRISRSRPIFSCSQRASASVRWSHQMSAGRTTSLRSSSSTAAVHLPRKTHAGNLIRSSVARLQRALHRQPAGAPPIFGRLLRPTRLWRPKRLMLFVPDPSTPPRSSTNKARVPPVPTQSQQLDIELLARLPSCQIARLIRQNCRARNFESHFRSRCRRLSPRRDGLSAADPEFYRSRRHASCPPHPRRSVRARAT